MITLIRHTSALCVSVAQYECLSCNWDPWYMLPPLPEPKLWFVLRSATQPCALLAPEQILPVRASRLPRSFCSLTRFSQHSPLFEPCGPCHCLAVRNTALAKYQFQLISLNYSSRARRARRLHLALKTTLSFISVHVPTVWQLPQRQSAPRHTTSHRAARTSPAPTTS